MMEVTMRRGNDSATCLCNGQSVGRSTRSRRDKEWMEWSSSGGKTNVGHKRSSGDRRQDWPRNERTS
ncbi:hypothetical protein BGW80DRAFT_1333661 [Lactifluus volemus]|nr:hypothetical protein BGW80DRAFT_1333661 [Lactifluus volemus]